MSEQPIDKKALKIALEEMLRERNPELKGFLEELLISFFAGQSHADHNTHLDMTEIRKKYALRREDFTPLHKIFQDAPSALDITQKLRK